MVIVLIIFGIQKELDEKKAIFAEITKQKGYANYDDAKTFSDLGYTQPIKLDALIK